MLDHVLIVQAAQGQVLVDILDEIRGLRVDLARFRSSSSPYERCFWHSLSLFFVLGGDFLFDWLELGSCLDCI